MKFEQLFDLVTFHLLPLFLPNILSYKSQLEKKGLYFNPVWKKLNKITLQVMAMTCRALCRTYITNTLLHYTFLSYFILLFFPNKILIPVRLRMTIHRIISAQTAIKGTA